MASRPIKIAIIGDDSQLKKTLKQTNKRLEGFGKNVAKVGATAGLAFAASATAVATKGVAAYSQFQSQMNEVMTLLPGAGKEVFDELGDQVKDLSKEMGILPDKVIPALYQSISAGIPKENVGEFLKVAAMAAKGGVTDLETAVDGITSVVNAYGSEVMSASEASDLLFTAVKLGKTDFGQLSNEVYKVGPIAAALGVDFGSVTAALANLTAQGTPTAVAATQMKAAFAELAKEGTKSDKAFRELSGKGLAGFLSEGGTFEEAIIMMKGHADDLGISVLDLFGSVEAGQGIMTLTADGGAAFANTLDQMNSSTGATQTAFETMDQGLAVTFDKIKANLAVMAIETGEKLAPHVLAATHAIMDAFERLQPHIERAKEVVKQFAIEFVERMTPHVERFVEVAKRVIDWVKEFIKENPHAALAALGVVVASIVVPAVLGLVAAFAALFSPVILIVAALAALAGGAVYAYENFETFRNVVDTVKDWMVNTFWPALKMVAEKIVEVFKVVVEFFRTDFVPMVKGFTQKVVEVWQKVADFFMTYLWPTIKKILGLITDGFKALVSYFRTTFLNHVQAVVDAIVVAWQTVADFFETYLWPTIKKILGLMTDGFKALVSYFQNNFLVHVKAVADALVTAWRAVADFFQTYLWPIVKAVFVSIVSVVENLWDVVVSVKDLIKALFTGDFKQVWFKFRDMVGEVIGFIIDLFIMLPARIMSAAKPLLGKFALIVSDFAVHLVGKIVKLVQAIPDQIVEFVSGIAADIGTLGKRIGSWIINGIVDAIKGAAGAIGGALKDAVPSPGDILGGVGGFFKGLNPFGGGDKKPPKPGTMTEEVYAFNPATGEVELVPQLGRGGIVTSPTLAMIGERGPEAVVPLNGAAGLGTTFNINVNAGLGTDGRSVGNQIVSALKQWERSNGSIPLSVSAL